MKNKIIMAATFGVLFIAGCSNEGAEVSYSKEVRPILDKSCLECHKASGTGEQKSGLNMESYESLMKGTKFGPVIEPGSGASSTLIRLISGHADPSLKMPHGDRQPIPEKDVETIKRWVDQGAKNN